MTTDLFLNIPLDLEVLEAIMVLRDMDCKSLVVGGAVRDAILGIEPKDIDIEVYNIDYETLSVVLRKYGYVKLTGKAFGVIKLTLFNGLQYDFSVPRLESKIGIGHTGFEAIFSKDITPEQAAERRDFTFNALAYDPLEKKLYDFFGGLKDLENKLIRKTSDKFSEDPLRILRAMQFQSRFGFKIHHDTNIAMGTMVRNGEMNELPESRIMEEWMKWAIKGVNPEMIFNFLYSCDLINQLPHLCKLTFTQQDKKWHPEGDVETHTIHVLSAMAEIVERESITGEDKAVLIFAALCHDIAKPECTKEELINGEMRITSKGHEEAGGKLTKEFLKAICIKQEIIDRVVPLVENHLAHVNIAAIPEGGNKLRAVRRLARRLGPATIKELLHLLEADSSGRPPLPKGMPESGKLLTKLADEVGVQLKRQPAIIRGRDLIKLGFTPGIGFKPILEATIDAEEQGLYSTVEEGEQWVLDNFKIR